MKKLRKEEIIAYWKERRERRARILEERRNGAFAQKMKPVYQPVFSDISRAFSMSDQLCN